MTTPQTLIPFINKENDFDLTLRQYIKNNRDISLSDESNFTSIIGKSIPTKYKLIEYLFSISTNAENNLENSRISLARAHFGKTFVQDINLQALDFYLEKEYKSVLFGFLTSDNILITLEKDDINSFGFKKFLTIVLMSHWSTRDGATPKKKVTLLVDCSKDTLGSFELRNSFFQNLKQAWSEVIKPSGLEQADFNDFIKLDFLIYTAYDLENRAAKTQLFDLSLSLHSSLRHEPDMITSGIAEIRSPIYSQLSSPSKPTRIKPLPLELYQTFHEDLWNSIKSTFTMPDLYDINCTERMNKLGEEQLEKLKVEILKSALYQVMEIRQRIEMEHIVHDFGTLGRRLYEEAIATLRGQSYTVYLLQDSERLEKERKEISQKIEFELYDLFEIQVKRLKEEILSNLVSRLSQTRKRMRSDEEFYINIRSLVEQEQESLVHEVEHTLSELRVFSDELGKRWEIQSHVKAVKEELSKYVVEFIKKEIQKYVNNIVTSTREELRASISFNIVETAHTVWEEVQAIFVSIVDEKERILTRFLEANTRINREVIEHQVQNFKRECFEYVLGTLRDNATDIDTQLCKLFEKRFVEIIKKKESSWSSEGQVKVFGEIEQTAKKLLQETGAVLQHLKHVKIDEEFFYNLGLEHNYPQHFLTDIKINQIQNTLLEKAKILTDRQKKNLKKGLKVRYRRKLREEFIFWMVFLFLFYIYLHWPDNLFLLIPILLVLGVKGLQYSGLIGELMKYVDQLKDTVEQTKNNLMSQATGTKPKKEKTL